MDWSHLTENELKELRAKADNLAAAAKVVTEKMLSEFKDFPSVAAMAVPEVVILDKMLKEYLGEDL